jgi:hypothetical protein
MMPEKSSVISETPASSSWSLYFASQPNHDSMLFDEKSYVERLEQLSSVLFGDSTDVEIIQCLGNSVKTEIHLRDDDGLADEFAGQLDTEPTLSMRIM